MEMFEKDWSTEKKIAFVVELLKEGTERLNNALSSLSNTFNLDDMIKETKNRMNAPVTTENVIIEETFQ